MEIIRAHIKDGLVINISIGDTDKPWIAPKDITIVELKSDTDAAIGYSYDGKEFTSPIPVEPVPVQPEPIEAKPTLEDRLTALESKIATLEGLKA
jgi:hypothetical protein